MLEVMAWDNQQLCGMKLFFGKLARFWSSDPQGGGNPLHNSNVAVMALHVRHYPFPAFQGNIAFVF